MESKSWDGEVLLRHLHGNSHEEVHLKTEDDPVIQLKPSERDLGSQQSTAFSPLQPRRLWLVRSSLTILMSHLAPPITLNVHELQLKKLSVLLKIKKAVLGFFLFLFFFLMHCSELSSTSHHPNDQWRSVLKKDAVVLISLYFRHLEFELCGSAA